MMTSASVAPSLSARTMPLFQLLSMILLILRRLAGQRPSARLEKTGPCWLAITAEEWLGNLERGSLVRAMISFFAMDHAALLTSVSNDPPSLDKASSSQRTAYTSLWAPRHCQGLAMSSLFGSHPLMPRTTRRRRLSGAILPIPEYGLIE